jgi:hypothetical protein
MQLKAYATRKSTRQFYRGIGYAELGVVMMKALSEKNGISDQREEGRPRLVEQLTLGRCSRAALLGGLCHLATAS